MEETKKINLEESLKVLTDVLVKSALDEALPENFSEHVDSIKNSYMAKNTENFSVCVAHKMRLVEQQLAKLVIHDLNEYPKNQRDNVVYIWLNFSKISHVLADLISRFEGHCCSVDKSRWLLNNYLKYIKTGEIPNMIIEDKCYWKPHFGIAEEWFEWIRTYIINSYTFSIDYLNISATLIKKGNEYVKEKE